MVRWLVQRDNCVEEYLLRTIYEEFEQDEL